MGVVLHSLCMRVAFAVVLSSEINGDFQRKKINMVATSLWCYI